MFTIYLAPPPTSLAIQNSRLFRIPRLCGGKFIPRKRGRRESVHQAICDINHNIMKIPQKGRFMAIPTFYNFTTHLLDLFCFIFLFIIYNHWNDRLNKLTLFELSIK